MPCMYSRRPSPHDDMNLDFAAWLPLQRWYAGRGRELVSAEAGLVVSLRDGLDLALVDVRYEDGSSECYQVLMRWETAPDDKDPSTGYIGSAGGGHAFDAAFDPASARYLLDLLERSATLGPVIFEKEAGASIRSQATPRVVEGEQTNTSVVFDGEVILKLFRRTWAGVVNPDIELSRLLARAGDPHVPRILGSFSVDVDGARCALGVLTEFAENSVNGWAMAKASTRDLFAVEDLRADEVGGDFAGESFRLGQAVASVHRTLADVLGVSTDRFPGETFVKRLLAVVTAHPQLEPYARSIEDRFRALPAKRSASR